MKMEEDFSQIFKILNNNSVAHFTQNYFQKTEKLIKQIIRKLEPTD